MKRYILCGTILLLWVCAQSAYGQSFYYFGKNKVQYSNFDWQLMRTPHFDIYFYPEEAEVARVGAAMAEESYTFLERKFSHTILRRIPLIFYGSPIHFRETNTIPGLLPESVAGFTEFVKGRVVLPHSGSFADFKRVIRHELVHVFTFDKIKTVLKKHGISNFHSAPLWFWEGLAEYWSSEWDSQADMVIRDALFSDSLVPIAEMHKIYGSFKMYKEGQSIIGFIAEKYGEDKIGLIFENWWKNEKFSEIFRSATGDPLTVLDSDWQYRLKKRYLPKIETSDFPGRIAKKLTAEGSNLRPALVPSHEDSSSIWFVFISNRTGYADIYQQSLSGDGEPERIVKGGRTAEFESFHALRSKLSVSRKGVLAFVSQSGERDVLYLWDLSEGRIVRELSFGPLVSLSSPSWSQDGGRIVLSGVDRGGISDLYVASVDDGRLERLTHDIYSDRDPDWAPDGERIVFSSDRTEFGEEGFYNLFIYELKTGRIKYLTYGRHNDLSPSWSPDGKKVAFASDRNGAFNLYIVSWEADERRLVSTNLLDPSDISDIMDKPADGEERTSIIQITEVLTGAFDPVWLSDGEGILFSAYEDGSFQIYRMDIPSGSIPILQHAREEEAVPSWTPGKIREDYVKSRVKYQPKLSLDLAQSQVVQDPEFGTLGGVQVALTDMLGNHHYYLFVSNAANSRGDLLRSFDFALTRLDLTRRANVAWGLFRLDERFLGDFSGRFRERRTGGFISFSYPFSRFERIETSLVVRTSDKEGFLGRGRKAFLASNFVNYVKDNSLWGPVGPIDGERYSLGIGQTVNLRASDIHRITVLLDYRHYFRLSRRSAFALRLLGRSSWGPEPQHFYMGGSWSFRGFRRRSIWGRNLVLLNNELRFPLIDNLLIGLPIGRIGFHAFRGALFFDVGNAWDDEFERLLGSFGAGVRLRLVGSFILRLDAARRTDFRSIDRKTYWDFFFGWDF